MQSENNSRRFISKKFKCPVCLKPFKKLVHANESKTSCVHCGHEHCYDIAESNEFNREANDRTYRLNFQNATQEQQRQYHTVTDIYDRSRTNLYGDANRQQQQQQQSQPQSQQQRPPQQQQQPSQRQQHRRVNDFTMLPQQHPLHFMFIPFSRSPFAGSVRRSPFNFGVFSSPFSDDFFDTSLEDFFLDNFASNFTSNFFNPMSRIVFMQSMNNNNQNVHAGNPPASKKTLDKLKRFKMSKEYCKKDEKDETKLEYPTCSICLMEVTEGQDTILVPCGHMFHDECIVKWLELHNSCPVCRFELPTDDPEYERERRERNEVRDRNINRNNNVRRMDLSRPENYMQQRNNNNNNRNNSGNENQQQQQESESEQNQQRLNINIQGEGNSNNDF